MTIPAPRLTNNIRPLGNSRLTISNSKIADRAVSPRTILDAITCTTPRNDRN